MERTSPGASLLRRRALWLLVTLGVGGCASSSTTGPPPRSQATDERSTEAEPAGTATTVSASAELLAVDGDVEPAADVVALLSPYSQQVAARAARVVGTLSAPLDKAERGAPESTLGNWASDALRVLITEAVGQRMDVCFTNNGGLRRSLPAGEVTEGDLVELMPFENAIVVMEVKGDRSRAIWSHLAARGDPASGLTYRRVDGAAVDLAIGGEPVDDERIYRICTNDYLYEGGGDYGLEDIESVTYTGILIRDVFIRSFEQAHALGQPVNPALDGRAVDVNTAKGPGT